MLSTIQKGYPHVYGGRYWLLFIRWMTQHGALQGPEEELTINSPGGRAEPSTEDAP
ncbi:unnamed protein product, partial [Larinioides sclopetarius]